MTGLKLPLNSDCKDGVRSGRVFIHLGSTHRSVLVTYLMETNNHLDLVPNNMENKLTLPRPLVQGEEVETLMKIGQREITR